MAKIAKNIKREPNNTKLREELHSRKRKYKSTLASKKRKYKDDIINQMNGNRKSLRFFWKLLDKLNVKNSEKEFKKGISGNRWKSHFESLFSKSDEIKIPDSHDTTGPLDYDITLEELNEASYILRPGKSTGKDGILNEMLLCLLKTHPRVILRLFNLILSSEKAVSLWNTTIFPQFIKKVLKWILTITGLLHFLAALANFIVQS